MKSALPDIGLHLRLFLGGLVGYAVISAVYSNYPDLSAGVWLVLGIPCGLAVAVPIVGYCLVYPFLHLMGRYEGDSRETWIVWLVLDTIGLTFGIVRIWYYIAEIIPDFRREHHTKIAGCD